MVLMVFAIKDLKTMYYRQPFFVQNEMVAIRTLSIPVTEEGSELNRFPKDFVLCHIGTFDDSNGLILSAEEVRVICGLDTIKENYQQKNGDVDIKERGIKPLGGSK